MSLLRRIARRAGALLHVDEVFSSYADAIRELEAHAVTPGLCAVFDPEALHLLVMTRERFLTKADEADRAALRAARGPGMPVVLISGTRVAPRALTIGELKLALQELESK
jgi:hypothetical protein